VLPKIKRELGVLLATFAALASGVTLWTWLAFECIPLEVFSNDTNWYTECGPPTPFARLLINVALLAAVSNATVLATAAFLAVRWAWKRAGGALLRYHSGQ